MKFILLTALLISACSTSTKNETAARNANEFPSVQSVLDKATSSGRIPGAIAFIEHKGKLSIYTSGVKNLETKAPIEADTIFRIASMTKPVLAVATLMLVEEGKIKLTEPISTYLPEFKNLRVLRRLNSPLSQTVPIKSAPTVRDLLTFTWGSGMLFFEPNQGENYPIQKEMRKLGVVTAPPLPPVTITPDEWLKRMATLPLMHQPGERWMYNTGSDVLGVLLARVAQMPLPELLEQKIFRPLGMNDTGFYVPAEKHARFQPAYSRDFKTSAVSVSDPLDGYYSKSPVFPSGSAGLVSTAADYLKFAKMLLNEGSLDGLQILSPERVREMTKDHISPKVKKASPFFPGFWKTSGWGYNVSVQTQPNGTGAPNGTYGWLGGFGTDWFNDPTNKISGVVMTQLSIDFEFFPEVRKAIYADLGSR